MPNFKCVREFEKTLVLIDLKRVFLKQLNLARVPASSKVVLGLILGPTISKTEFANR